MKKMVEGWIHIPGIHCGSVAIRDIMKFYGYEFSEALCFGLGSGMGFFYTVSEEQTPTRMIFMRGPGMEYNFFNALGKPTRWKHQEDAQQALRIAMSWIDRDVPVLVQTDLYYLDYYNTTTHFPGHVIVLWGYDDVKECVFVSDTGFEDLKAVSFENMKRARTSQATGYVLKNNWFEVEITEPLPPLEEVLPGAIRKNAQMMMEGVTSARGLSSVHQIRRWSEDLPHWAEAEDWQWCARFGYQVIAKRGVDGAGFRWMYRDFLREAEEILPRLRDLGLSEKMDKIGEKWAEVGGVLREISEEDKPRGELLSRASSLALELWEREHEYYELVLEKV